MNSWSSDNDLRGSVYFFSTGFEQKQYQLTNLFQQGIQELLYHI